MLYTIMFPCSAALPLFRPEYKYCLLAHFGDNTSSLPECASFQDLQLCWAPFPPGSVALQAEVCSISLFLLK